MFGKIREKMTNLNVRRAVEQNLDHILLAKGAFQFLNNFGNLVFQNNVENNRTFPCSVAWISPDLPSSSDSST